MNRLCKEIVTGKNREASSVHRASRWSSAPCTRIIDDIIVHQRCHMNQLNSGGGLDGTLIQLAAVKGIST